MYQKQRGHFLEFVTFLYSSGNEEEVLGTRCRVQTRNMILRQWLRVVTASSKSVAVIKVNLLITDSHYYWECSKLDFVNSLKGDS